MDVVEKGVFLILLFYYSLILLWFQVVSIVQYKQSLLLI